MITKSIYETYEPEFYSTEEPQEDSLWFVYRGSKLLLKCAGKGVFIPSLLDIGDIVDKLRDKQYIGKKGGKQCFCCEIEENDLPEEMEPKDLRPLFGVLEDGMFLLAGRAFQTVNWNRNTKFCGKCGARTENKKEERAKICPECGFHSYPNVVPAIIVAVRKNDQILLAHANHFSTDLYSVIAGFVEAGETFEECVKREVMEEVGIKVKNIKYFGSQPWPFPNSIMVAFTADYDEGDIAVDGVEIGTAGWFSKDNLPNLPGGYSIARALINWFLDAVD